jgi:hypothetical protein
MTDTPSHSGPRELTASQAAAVRAELAAILASPLFSASKRCHDLLEFVVDRALEGDFESLTERFIGARVFGRPIEYETATDAIVRVRANDVRRRLSQYYSERHSSSAATISLISGSYVPEFHFPEENRAGSGEGTHDEGLTPQGDPGAVPSHEEPWPAGPRRFRGRRLRLPVLVGIPLLIVAAVVAGLWIRHRSAPTQAIDAFWEPILSGKSDILICAGGNTFMQNPVPEFVTAGKEIDYPYFSLQTAVSTTLLSALIEQHGATAQFRFAASTSLPEFHEHPIILLNAFNNIWTQRLVEPLRFSLTPREFRPQSIVDRLHPEISWHRDPAIPYESADDYALVARFWDKTTDNWVVVLAGLGRNGTEAATRFVVDPHYMQQLRERLGRDFSNRNIEVVLKVSVVDGKTGAPAIMAAYSW